jgi:hypothetical protein
VVAKRRTARRRSPRAILTTDTRRRKGQTTHDKAPG